MAKQYKDKLYEEAPDPHTGGIIRNTTYEIIKEVEAELGDRISSIQQQIDAIVILIEGLLRRIEHLEQQ